MDQGIQMDYGGISIDAGWKNGWNMVVHELNDGEYVEDGWRMVGF